MSELGRESHVSPVSSKEVEETNGLRMRIREEGKENEEIETGRL